jgi:predicted MFS family arabinose efflux permease
MSKSTEASDRAANWVLLVLTLTYTLNYLDRYLLTILLEPIKQDLDMSDTGMGFLIGPAFALFYTAMGVPIARLADRTSRINVIAIGFTIWSAFTALSGLARSFVQLAIARVMVGVGEAAGGAPSHSLLSDTFPPERRANALAIFQMGVYLGQFLGLAVGGFLVAPLGWRWTFIAVGLPGVLFALLLKFTVPEPERGRFDEAASSEQKPLREVISHLLGMRTFRWLALGTGLASFAGTGYGFWVPTLFVRVHGMSFGEVGLTFGLVAGISSLLGTLLAGRLGAWLGERDPRWLLWLPALAVTLSLPFLVAVSVWPTPYVAMAFAVPAGLAGAGWAPLAYTVVQNLVPASMRAVAASILIFSITLLGMGAGPQAVGIVSDWFAPSYGVESVRYAMVAVLATSALGAFAIFWASRSLLAELPERA